jgi:polynucleotide kinase-phosphatase
MNIAVPEMALLVLIGPSGAGKSTFAQRHFRTTEVLSSDLLRGWVSDDETDQSASADAFELLHLLASKRLRRGCLTVIDATNVQPDPRKQLLALARKHHVLPVAIVFDIPERICLERNRTRPERRFGPHVVRQQAHNLRQSLGRLRGEGFRGIHVFTTPEMVDACTLTRQPLWTDRRRERGPFDLIGDIHGCFHELRALLTQLGYTFTPDTEPDGRPGFAVTPPPGRKAVFLGDLVDRGPASHTVLRLAMRMVANEQALCLPGNHERKLLRKLNGQNVNIGHGLAETLRQLAEEPPAFTERVRQFLDSLVSHYVLDDGKLVVAHAGLKEELQGRASPAVRDFALYGETTGEIDEFGLPVRANWALDYRGKALVVHGHTPVVEPQWLNRTLCIDTGCVFGGALTALRYPENTLHAVPAEQAYAEPRRPFRPTPPPAEPALTPQQTADTLLDLADVTGKRLLSTRLHPGVLIQPAHAAAALEVLSRFAVDPRWLIYLPPTMAPVETSRQPGLLEHPDEAFAYFRTQNVSRVVCEQKHMGSRAVLIVCRDAASARSRFAIDEPAGGVILTRTGRHFFDDARLTSELLAVVRHALTTAEVWERLHTNWVCLDAELMPWSAKAQALLREQYAAVGAAARADTQTTRAVVQAAAARTGKPELAELAQRCGRRERTAGQFVTAYRRYCWSVQTVHELKIAPFHLLASENTVYADRTHLWHLDELARIAAASAGVLVATPLRTVDLADAAQVTEATAWWEQITAEGAEGMVVKPEAFVTPGLKGLCQPALKVRGAEYLRIIYGPDYDAPEHLERLRTRGVGTKRNIALREFVLGIEALERFVKREPLRKVHECVAGVLALESEPVDPRL